MEENNKKIFKGVWIPKFIVLDENLSLEEKLIFAIIVNLSKKIGKCNPKNIFFMKFLKVSENRISHIIGNLKLKNKIKTNLLKVCINKSQKKYRIRREIKPLV